MNSKERLYWAVNSQPIDRVPCICPGGMMNMIVTEILDDDLNWPSAHTDPVKMAKLAMKSHELGGFENLGVPFCMTVEAEALGASVHLGNCQTEPKVTEYAIRRTADLEGLKSVNFQQGRLKTVIESVAYLKENTVDVPIIGNLVGPISLATSILDPMVFYKDLRKNPKEVHKLLEAVTEVIIEFGKKQLAAGADWITISDPSGTGEILGERNFNAFALPYLNKIIDALNEVKTNSVIVHICGRLNQVYGSIQELNNSVISFDAVTNISVVKENVTNKVLMGNVSTYTLEFGTEEQVAGLAQKAIKDGVGILSPACGVGMGTPVKNLIALTKGFTHD